MSVPSQRSSPRSQSTSSLDNGCVKDDESDNDMDVNYEHDEINHNVDDGDDILYSSDNSNNNNKNDEKNGNNHASEENSDMKKTCMDTIPASGANNSSTEVKADIKDLSNDLYEAIKVSINSHSLTDKGVPPANLFRFGRNKYELGY